MPTYNKLVRDRIPEIIEASGDTYDIQILPNEEYIQCLEEKAIEELAEYQAAEDDDSAIEELADLMEVIRALALARGYTIEELEGIRKKKEDERGGFSEQIYLIDVKESRD